MEIWRDIKDYEGYYQVSNLGRVKAVERIDNKKHKRLESIKAPTKDKNGYVRISLFKNGEYKKKYVHQLVAQAFLPNPNNYTIINHKNEITDDNKVENLEWCTHKYNMNYGTRIKRQTITPKLKSWLFDNPVLFKDMNDNVKAKICKELYNVIGISKVEDFITNLRPFYK